MCLFDHHTSVNAVFYFFLLSCVAAPHLSRFTACMFFGLCFIFVPLVMALMPSLQTFHNSHFQFKLVQQYQKDVLFVDSTSNSHFFQFPPWTNYLQDLPLRQATHLVLLKDHLWHDNMLLGLDHRIDRHHIYAPNNRMAHFSHPCENIPQSLLCNQWQSTNNACVCIARPGYALLKV